MGHNDSRTTDIYADYGPDSLQGRAWAEQAFGQAGINAGINMNASQANSYPLELHQQAAGPLGHAG